MNIEASALSVGKYHLSSYGSLILEYRLEHTIMIIVTILMMIGFIMMHKVFIGQIILGLVWLFHIIYFLFGIKTIKIIDR